MGLPVSYGCVRMSSNDVIKLYEMVGLGAQVTIVERPWIGLCRHGECSKRFDAGANRLHR